MILNLTSEMHLELIYHVAKALSRPFIGAHSLLYNYHISLFLMFYCIFWIIYLMKIQSNNKKLFEDILYSINLTLYFISVEFYNFFLEVSLRDKKYFLSNLIYNTQTYSIRNLAFAIVTFLFFGHCKIEIQDCSLICFGIANVLIIVLFFFVEELFLTILSDSIDNIIDMNENDEIAYTIEWYGQFEIEMEEYKELKDFAKIFKEDISDPSYSDDSLLFLSRRHSFSVQFFIYKLFSLDGWRLKYNDLKNAYEKSLCEEADIHNLFEINFYYRIFVDFLDYIDNFIEDNENVLYFFMWPWAFYYYYVIWNWSLLYLVESYMIFFGVSLFCSTLLFITVDYTTIKKLGIKLADQMFYVALGAFWLFLYNTIIYDPSGVQFSLLNSAYIFSSGIFYFKFWIVFFFFY